MPFGDQDLAIFFQDGSVVTLADKSTFMAHFDTPEMVDTFGQMRIGKLRDGAAEISGQVSIRYATASAPAKFGHGSIVTVNGTQYKVRSTMKEGDGQVSVAELSQ